MASSAANVNTLATFASVYNHLLDLPAPLLAPGHPTESRMTAVISNLRLHPTLEAAFHLLNCDLPSAHFLLRMMQAPPALEGMFLHGILHRIEGDFDNARAWYENVADSEVFKTCWACEEDGKAFIDEVQTLLEKRADAKAVGELQYKSLREIKSVIEFCRKKFGESTVEDAREAYAQPTEPEKKRFAEEMIIGDKGHRKF